jgi:3',5'-cyclic AMP phosphodiesterase CpdA
LPNDPDSFKFAVIGDSGTGGRAQLRVAQVLAAYQEQFAYKTVLMAGDNMYGSQRPSDYLAKFERPYRVLLDRGVQFYAALGNHDRLEQRFYEPFHLNGERYHTVRLSPSIQLFVLDSSRLDAEQIAWLKSALESSGSPWKFILLHHPLYSAAKRHGSDLVIRQAIEPLLVSSGVDAVFAGHDHVYERKTPQQGITHFVVGNSAKLRKGDLRRDETTALGFDTGYSFLLVEVLGDELHFQAISDESRHVDGGVIRERGPGGTPPGNGQPPN